LTLLNEERIAAGKGPIGFVNPVLYEHPEVLNDIVNGTNLGCYTENGGFRAVPGYVHRSVFVRGKADIFYSRWDPVTGLGTANYPKMKSLFLSLP